MVSGTELIIIQSSMTTTDDNSVTKRFNLERNQRTRVFICYRAHRSRPCMHRRCTNNIITHISKTEWSSLYIVHLKTTDRAPQKVKINTCSLEVTVDQTLITIIKTWGINMTITVKQKTTLGIIHSIKQGQTRCTKRAAVLNCHLLIPTYQRLRLWKAMT